MATASDLAVLWGESTYKVNACPNLASILALYVNSPRKIARSEVVAIFYEIVYELVRVDGSVSISSSWSGS